MESCADLIKRRKIGSKCYEREQPKECRVGLGNGESSFNYRVRPGEGGGGWCEAWCVPLLFVTESSKWRSLLVISKENSTSANLGKLTAKVIGPERCLITSSRVGLVDDAATTGPPVEG